MGVWRLRLGFVHVFHAKFCEFGAEAIEIEPQFPRLETCTRFLFLTNTLVGQARHVNGRLPRDDHHAVDVGDDDIAGRDRGAGADHRDVD